MSIIHRYTLSIDARLDTGSANGSTSGAGAEAGSTQGTLDTLVPASSYDHVISVGFTPSNLQSLIIVADQDCTLKVGGTNEVQSISHSGTVSGGTFTITFESQTTSAIAYNATAATVQSALEALSNIASGDVSCTGGPLPGTDVVVTFQANLGKSDRTQMTVDNSSITGGGSITVSTTTAGASPDVTKTLKAGRPFFWSRSDGYYTCPFSSAATTFYVTTTSATLIQGRYLTS